MNFITVDRRQKYGMPAPARPEARIIISRCLPDFLVTPPQPSGPLRASLAWRKAALTRWAFFESADRIFLKDCFEIANICARY